MIQKISIKILKSAETQADKAAAILRRVIGEKTASEVVLDEGASVRITLDIDGRIGTEGYRIDDETGGGVRISGNDPLGLVCGAGRFLRDSAYGGGVFTPGPWRGTSIPEKELRGVFFATHFYNFYHTAPVAEIERYLEDIALWGNNFIGIWFDMHHYHSIEDPEAVDMLGRLKAIARAAKDIGLKILLVTLANEGFKDAPAELRADWTVGHGGYRIGLSHYHTELCPSKPEGMKLLLKWREQVLQAFQDIEIDYFSMAAYDQGGCTCDDCAPWGSNGYIRTFEKMVGLARQYFPNIKTILVTWYFDKHIDGEWEGLGKAFAKRPDWLDYILADDNNGQYPEYIMKHGVPGGLPLISFPEISMYKQEPWGGCGANPLPDYLQKLNEQTRNKIRGGISYSEGIYEDLNMAIVSQMFWDSSRTADDIAREYIRYEFSAELADQILKAFKGMEHSNSRGIYCFGHALVSDHRSAPAYRIVIEKCQLVEETYSIMTQADRRLPEHVRTAWRWRILLIRALIDHELVNNYFEVSVTAETALRELTGIYHAEHADYVVSPPTPDMMKRFRG